MVSISNSSPSTTQVSFSQPQPIPVSQRHTERPKNPGLWNTVANFFKALFGSRPTWVTSEQKLLVGEKFKGDSLNTIPDRMWKAVGTKQPQESDAAVKLPKNKSFELLERAKLIGLFSNINRIDSEGVPEQMANWCNPLDQTHLGDFMQPGKPQVGDERIRTSVLKLHQLGCDLKLVPQNDLQKLNDNAPEQVTELSVSPEELKKLNLESGDQRLNKKVTPDELFVLKKYLDQLKTKSASKLSRQEVWVRNKLPEDIRKIEEIINKKKTADCDPYGHAKNIKNALLPENFATEFNVNAGKGLVMDPDTGLLANIAFNSSTREMAVSFTGNSILLANRNVPNSIRAVCGGIPANFKHADQMIGALKEHIQKRNAEMQNANSDAQPITLHLTGYCMGGGVAAYVGGKHKIAFDTFNPMPLGLGLQRDMGKEGMEWANTHGKRYVMETDHISDANTPHLLKSGMRTLQCQSPGQTFVVPRTYVTRTDNAGNLESDVHGLFRHMIENLHKGRGTNDIELGTLPESAIGLRNVR